MSKACIAAQFICDHQDDLARQSLNADLNPESIKLLSLLLRKQRLFDDENALILALHKDYPNDTYIQERYQWHQQPLFDKLVPRQALHLPCDPLWLPQQSTLDQLCIVTGGDAKYFDFLIENIESIKITQRYSDVPLCVLDYGLTDDQKQILLQRFKVKLYTPKIEVEATHQVLIQHDQNTGRNVVNHLPWPEEERKTIKFFSPKTHLQDIIPGYRFYLWVDTDAWVQDERALDKHLVRCERQGISGSWHGSGTFGNQFGLSGKDKTIPLAHPDQLELMLDRKAITEGSFCIDAESVIAKEWFPMYKDLASTYGFHWQLSELCLTYLSHKYGVIDNEGYPDGFTIGPEGFPVVCADDDILRRPSTLEPIGTPHLVGSAKKLHFIPTQKITAPLNGQQVQQHKQLTGHWFHHPNQKIVPNQVTTSIRFRVWPWDVSEVDRELHAFAKEVLCHA